MKRGVFLSLLVLIFLCGSLLRTIGLDKVPIELFGDEVDAGYQAYSLLTTGRDYKGNFLPVYIQSFSEWRAPLLMYSMVPFIKTFGLNEWGVRLTAAFWGIINVVGFWLLLREFKVSQGLQLAGVFLLAILPWHIQYSRAGYELTLLSTLLLFGTLALLKTLARPSTWMIAIAATLFGLTFYTYSTANVFVPIFAAGVIFLTLRQLVFNKKYLKTVFLFFVFMALISGPLIISVLWGHAAERFQKFSIFSNEATVDYINRYRSAPGENKLAGLVFYNKPVYWLKSFVGNYLNAYSSDFLFGHGDVTFRQSLHEVGGFYWTEAVLILVGIIVTFRKKVWDQIDKIMALWLIVAPIPSSLTIDGATHASRLFYIIFPLVYFAAIGFVFISTNKKLRILLGVVILTLLFEFINYQNYYWKHYRIESWRWWQFGYKESFSAVDSEMSSGKYKKVLIENTYEPAYIRYLFWMRVNPSEIFNKSDEMKPNGVGNISGFCLSIKDACFVDFQNKSVERVLEKGNLYLISQDRNVPGDWDWEKSPPENVSVLRTIRSPYGYPIFYLLAKKN